MYCMHCGEKIDENLLICPHCGTAQNQVTKKRLWWNWLGNPWILCSDGWDYLVLYMEKRKT